MTQDTHQASRDLTSAVQDFLAEAPAGARGEYETEAGNLIALAALIKTAATTMDRLSAAKLTPSMKGSLGWLADTVGDELTQEGYAVFVAALKSGEAS